MNQKHVLLAIIAYLCGLAVLFAFVPFEVANAWLVAGWTMLCVIGAMAVEEKTAHRRR